MIRRAGRRLGQLLLLVLITLLMAEGALQVASRFVSTRASDLRPGAAHRVLCVGDSHTYGVLLPENASYPAQLQGFLDEQAAGAYSVVNLGVPGMNTTQVLNRLPDSVSRYRPDTLIVWCGNNDAWNSAEVDTKASDWRFRLEGLASHVRLYRLVRVWLFNRQLHRKVTSAQDWEGRRQKIDIDTHGVTIHHGGSTERVQHVWSFPPQESAVEERAAPDFRAMAEYARTAAIRLIFIAYPREMDAFAVANQAMRQVAAEYGLTVIESGHSVERVPEDQREFLWGAHPNGPMYREIARDVAAALSRDSPPHSSPD